MKGENDPDTSPPKRREPREKKTTLLLIGGGIFVGLLALCVLAAGGSLYFLKSIRLPAIIDKPPYYGVYLKKEDGYLAELHVNQGGPGEVATSTAEASPTLVVWLQHVDFSLVFLAPKNGRDTQGRPYRTTHRGDGVFELVPSAPLAAGDYCLRQDNTAIPRNVIPYWCFAVVARGADSH